MSKINICARFVYLKSMEKYELNLIKLKLKCTEGCGIQCGLLVATRFFG